jgi:hypothetical protein
MGRKKETREIKIARAEDKYGESLMITFGFLKNGYVTLQSVGGLYGFSREYARQLYKIIYNEPYTKVVKARAKCRASLNWSTGDRTDR